MRWLMVLINCSYVPVGTVDTCVMISLSSDLFVYDTLIINPVQELEDRTTVHS